jgi:hypothetical protein
MRRCFKGTNIRSTSSVFMAGRSVKVLMAMHERNHVTDNAVCCCRNENPYATGQKAPMTNRIVRISRWMYPSACDY